MGRRLKRRGRSMRKIEGRIIHWLHSGEWVCKCGCTMQPLNQQAAAAHMSQLGDLGELEAVLEFWECPRCQKVEMNAFL